MQRIAVSHANEFVRLARAMVGFVAQLQAYALLSFGLGGAQIAEADCAPPSVPTIDLRSPTTASLRWGDHADFDGIQNRINEPSATSTIENNFILNHLGIMYARGHLGTGQTTSAERLALAIIDRIGERCEYSRTSYEDAVALSSAP